MIIDITAILLIFMADTKFIIIMQVTIQFTHTFFRRALGYYQDVERIL